MICIILSWDIVGILSTKTLELLFPVWSEEHLVYLYKDRRQGCLVVLLLELRIILELLDEVITTELCDLGSTMSIEHGKKGETWNEVHCCDVGVFVGFAPALHARRSKFKLHRRLINGHVRTHRTENLSSSYLIDTVAGAFGPNLPWNSHLHSSALSY